MNSDGSRCGEKTMSGTAELSVKVTPRDARQAWNAVQTSGASLALVQPGPRQQWSANQDGGFVWQGPTRVGIMRGLFCRPARRENPENPMSSYTTNEIRGGMKLLIDGDPYSVIDNEYVKPGKGQAFNRIKVRNLKTGRTVEKSYRSGESIEAADVMDTEMQYLYKDGDFWTFMNPENYEQLQAGEAAVGDAAQWLKDGTICIITLWNGVPLVVTPPPHIELKVVETDPGVRGDTATGGSKP